MAELQVRFHRSLYPTRSVETASARFAHLGALSVTETDADVLVVLAGLPERHHERVADELRNHALFQVVVDTRSAC